MEAVSPADTAERVIEQPQWGADNPATINLSFEGTDRGDTIKAGSGSQTVNGGAGRDRLISYGDAGEPDPAQTDGAEGRVNPALPQGTGNDSFTGGSGADRFEFHALLNARAEVIAQHVVLPLHIGSFPACCNAVLKEFSDDIAEGDDMITDYSKGEGDKIVVRGHTVEIASVTYGSDAQGDYSLITVISQQGNGGAGGANTATGAHDEDPLGTIKVYGDTVTKDDIKVQAAGVFDGVDRLNTVDALGDYNGGVQAFSSNTDGDQIVTAPDDIKTVDQVEIGLGAQSVSTGAGRDTIRVFGDAGEPDPAQTIGTDGRITPQIDPELANDVIFGGQDKDTFIFNALLNATDAVLARHTRDDGSVNWRKVAGENDAVHDHWVEGIGNDVLVDFSNQDGDKLILRGHTVEIAGIAYGEDEGGDYSVISMRSQQGDGGGAHDEDDLGTLKVYGDKVTKDDIKVQSKVFDGVDKLGLLEDQPELIAGGNSADVLNGTEAADNMHGRRGNDLMNGNDGDDFMFGESGHDVMMGGAGNDFLEGGHGRDVMMGGDGMDTFFMSSGRDMAVGGAEADVFTFFGKTCGAEIADWQDGLDKIDFSRADKVQGYDDLDINMTSDTSATLSFQNDQGKDVEIELLSDTSFELTTSNFIF